LWESLAPRLQEDGDAPILDRIVRGLVQFYDAGWRPPRSYDDPVVWMNRSHNKVADGLADLTMDRGRSWAKLFETSIDPREANWVIHTDGDRRSNSCAAASSIVGFLSCRNGLFNYEPWFAQGAYLNGGATVFQAEAIAIDEAMNWALGRLQFREQNIRY